MAKVLVVTSGRPAGAMLVRLVMLGLSLGVSLAVALLAATITPMRGISSIADAMPAAAITLAGIIAAMFAGAFVSGLGRALLSWRGPFSCA